MTNEHKDLLSQIQVPAELDHVLPTHQCIVCFAAWKLWADGEGHPSTKASWSLMSRSCGPCCDNVQMAGQIEELPLERRIISFANNVVPEIGNAIGSNALFSLARAVLKAGIHHAALAVRPEPAGAGRPVPETDIKPMLEFTIPHVSSRGEVFVLKADVDAHVAAQVAKIETAHHYALVRTDMEARQAAYAEMAADSRSAPQAQQPVASGESNAQLLRRSCLTDKGLARYLNGDTIVLHPSDLDDIIAAAKAAPAPDAGARDAAPAAVEAIPNELNYWKEIAKDQAELLATLTAQAAPALEDGTLEQLLTRYWDLAFDEGKTGESSGTEAQRTLFAIRHIKSTPAKPAQDLVAAIETIQPDLYSDDSDPTPSYKLGRIEGFREARRHAAALVAAHLKGTT